MPYSGSKRPIRILLVEDNEGDVLLVKEAFKAIGASVALEVASTGSSALECLHTGRARPDLVILDLNLPEKSGLDVLREIRSDGSLSDIPIVIFSSSYSYSDVQSAYQSFANTYIRKPVDVDEFFEVVASLQRYWGHIAQLPAR